MSNFNTVYIVLPILTILMFDLGLTLKLSDFTVLFKKPKALLLGMAGQLIVLPCIAVAIGSALNLNPIFYLGLILVACCPGGSSSNIFSKVADGDVALSVSLTACSSIITLFTLPVVMNYATASIGEAAGISLPVGNLIKQNLVTMLLPIIAGILVNRFRRSVANRIDRVLSKCALPSLIFMAAIFWIANNEVFKLHFRELGLSTGILILVSILAAAALSAIFRLTRKHKRTIVIEVGMQNAAQAIAIASSPFVFNNPAMASTAIVYALMMNIILLSYVAIIKIKVAKKTKQDCKYF